MNNLQLKALRQGLGLTVAEATDIAQVTKRSFQYWEAGKVPVPNNVAITINRMASHYDLVLKNMLVEVESATWRNTDPDKPTPIIPKLPFYHSFESFQMKTKCDSVAHWRIYQSVISQLLLLGKISELDDDAKIPENWEVWNWLDGHYDM